MQNIRYSLFISTVIFVTSPTWANSHINAMTPSKGVKHTPTFRSSTDRKVHKKYTDHELKAVHELNKDKKLKFATDGEFKSPHGTK